MRDGCPSVSRHDLTGTEEMNVCVTGQPNYTVSSSKILFTAFSTRKQGVENSMSEIYVKVKPGSEEFELEHHQFPIFYLEEPAENGQANNELCKRLENILAVKPGIVSGYHSKRKKIAIDIPEKQVKHKLEEF